MKSPHLLLTVVLFFLFACGIMPLTAKSDVLPNPQTTVESRQNQEAPETKFDGILTSSTSEAVFCVSAEKSLNLRLSPSTSAAADPKGLQHGDRVERIGDAPGWYKIVTADGRRGWVKMEYVEVCE